MTNSLDSDVLLHPRPFEQWLQNPEIEFHEILVGLKRFPYWNIQIPNILGSIPFRNDHYIAIEAMAIDIY